MSVSLLRLSLVIGILFQMYHCSVPIRKKIEEIEEKDYVKKEPAPEVTIDDRGIIFYDPFLEDFRFSRILKRQTDGGILSAQNNYNFNEDEVRRVLPSEPTSTDSTNTMDINTQNPIPNQDMVSQTDPQQTAVNNQVTQPETDWMNPNPQSSNNPWINPQQTSNPWSNSGRASAQNPWLNSGAQRPTNPWNNGGRRPEAPAANPWLSAGAQQPDPWNNGGRRPEAPAENPWLNAGAQQPDPWNNGGRRPEAPAENPWLNTQQYNGGRSEAPAANPWYMDANMPSAPIQNQYYGGPGQGAEYGQDQQPYYWSQLREPDTYRTEYPIDRHHHHHHY